MGTAGQSRLLAADELVASPVVVSLSGRPPHRAAKRNRTLPREPRTRASPTLVTPGTRLGVAAAVAGLPVATRLFASARAQVRCQKSPWRDHLLSVAVSVAAVLVNHPRDHEYAPYRHAPDNPGCCRTRSDARSTPARKQ